MHVSVAICTWNRSKLLDQTLSQFERVRIPAGVSWELLVVNNNCTDDTDAVIAKYQDALPIRRLLETKQGQSNARNCAMENATGEILLWTDDDVLVDEDWIVEYCLAFDKYPTVDYFGGTVDPWFETAPPQWIQRNIQDLQGPFAIRQLGNTVRLFEEREGPFGANMAHRLTPVKKYRFDDRRGRIGNQLFQGDDEAFNRQLKLAGHSGVWVGTAKVRHYITSERFTLDYLKRFYSGIGRTTAKLGAYSNYPKIFGVPRYHIKQLLLNFMLVMIFAGFRGKRWLSAFKASAIALGVIFASLSGEESRQ